MKEGNSFGRTCEDSVLVSQHRPSSNSPAPPPQQTLFSVCFEPFPVFPAWCPITTRKRFLREYRQNYFMQCTGFLRAYCCVVCLSALCRNEWRGRRILLIYRCVYTLYSYFALGPVSVTGCKREQRTGGSTHNRPNLQGDMVHTELSYSKKEVLYAASSLRR
jgi:hypothetical protein